MKTAGAGPRPTCLVFELCEEDGERRAFGVYADLVESSVDMYSRDVANQLGFELTGRLTPEIGAQVAEAFQKHQPQPANPTQQ